MDEKKIRDFVKQAHPTREIVDDDADRPIAADPDADDVDVGATSVRTWRKFGAPPEAAPARSRESLRELFRPRELKGARPSPAGSGADSARAAAPMARRTGKLALKRTVPAGRAADAEDSLDLLVDEDHGVIGESDSPPETKKKR